MVHPVTIKIHSCWNQRKFAEQFLNGKSVLKLSNVCDELRCSMPLSKSGSACVRQWANNASKRT